MYPSCCRSMDDPLLDRTLLYVTGKGGVGKTTVAAALGLAAAGAGGARSCARSPSRTASRARSPARACSASRRSSSPRTCGRSASTRTRRCRSGSRASSAGTALRLITGSSAFQHFVAAAPGREGADHDREGLGARAARALGRAEPHLRPGDRRRAASGHGLAMLTAPSTFGEIARVGPIRRQAFKIRDMLADPRRTGYVAVALPEEMPVIETLELGDRLHAAVGLGLDAIVVNGVYPARFSGKEAEALRAAARTGSSRRRSQRSPPRCRSTSARARSARTCAGSSARPMRPCARCRSCSTPRSGSRSTGRWRRSSRAIWVDAAPARAVRRGLRPAHLGERVSRRGVRVTRPYRRQRRV